MYVSESEREDDGWIEVRDGDDIYYILEDEAFVLDDFPEEDTQEEELEEFSETKEILGLQNYGDWRKERKIRKKGRKLRRKMNKINKKQKKLLKQQKKLDKKEAKLDKKAKRYGVPEIYYKPDSRTVLRKEVVRASSAPPTLGEHKK